MRRRAPLAELDLERNEDVADVLATLADSRLVTVGEGSVEVAHEALLREWPRLREWIEEDAEGRRLRRHITQAATEWDAAGRDQGELYRGARLAAALDWSADHAFELNELERDVRHREPRGRRAGDEAGPAHEPAPSRAARGRRGPARRGRRGGIFAVIQRGEARDAETAQLAQRLGAQALVEEDLDRSLLLARQAVAIDDSPQTRGYLLADLQRSPAVVRILHGERRGGSRGIAVSPDGKALAVGVSATGFASSTPGRSSNRRAAAGVQPGERSPTARTGDARDGGWSGTTGDLRLLDAHTQKQLAQVRLGRARRRASRSRMTARGSWWWSRCTRPRAGSRSATPPRSGRSAPGSSRGASPAALGSPVVDGSQHRADPRRPLARHHLAGGELTWWDLESRKPTRTLQVADGLSRARPQPGWRNAAIGLDDGIQLIDLRTGAVRESAAPSASPIWLQFSPDGKTIVSTSRDGTVTVWDAGPPTPRETLRGHSDSVWQPVFSPDGRTLYTTSTDASAIVWDLGRERRFERPFTFTHDRGA